MGRCETSLLDTYSLFTERLNYNEQVRWTESASIVRELKRATFTFKRADYQDLLTRIKEDNDNLDKLSSQNIELEQGRRGRYSGRLLGIARKFYKSIYNTLRSSIVCDCPEPHNVHLELVSHSSVPTPHDDEDMIAQDLHCRVVLSNTPNPAKIDQTAWLWNELILRLAEVPKKQAPTIKSPDLQIPRKKGGVKSVRFSTLESAHSKQMQQSNGSVTLLESATTSLAIGTAVAISSDRSDLPELVDLCAAIRHAEKQRMADCYGYIIDRSMPPSSKYEVYPVTTRIDHETWTRISLRDILKSKSKMQPQLTYTDKLRLAVAISSSVLQLQGTPWLPDILTAKDIFFIRRNDVPLYKHVFIAQPLPESGSSPSTTNPMKQTPTIWNPTILALRSLGILLIEIVCGKTLDTLRSPEDTLVANGIGDFLSDCMTARRIAAEVCQFVGYKYESAVRRCIQCDFDHPDPSFEDDRFRQDVFHGVIALLRR